MAGLWRLLSCYLASKNRHQWLKIFQQVKNHQGRFVTTQYRIEAKPSVISTAFVFTKTLTYTLLNRLHSTKSLGGTQLSREAVVATMTTTTRPLYFASQRMSTRRLRGAASIKQLPTNHSQTRPHLRPCLWEYEDYVTSPVQPM